MDIKIRHTQKGGWAEIYINGEYIGKQIRIKKDDFLNNDINIVLEKITGYERVFKDKEHNLRNFTWKTNIEKVSEYNIKR